MRYSDFAIEQNKKWLFETAMKNSTPKRHAGHLHEAAEQIAQLQADLKAQVADMQKVRHGVWLPILESEITGWNPEFAGRDPVGGYICSICKNEAIYSCNDEWVLSAFCPYCGARMDGDEE